MWNTINHSYKEVWELWWYIEANILTSIPGEKNKRKKSAHTKNVLSRLDQQPFPFIFQLLFGSHLPKQKRKQTRITFYYLSRKFFGRLPRSFFIILFSTFQRRHSEMIFMVNWGRLKFRVTKKFFYSGGKQKKERMFR